MFAWAEVSVREGVAGLLGLLRFRFVVQAFLMPGYLLAPRPGCGCSGLGAVVLLIQWV